MSQADLKAAADQVSSHNSFFHSVSYAQRVAGNGMKAQSGNPEVRVRGADPVVNQIIDKLKHVIQVSAGWVFMGILNLK